VADLWLAGHDDAQRVMNRPEACQITEIGNGFRVLDA
jgi:hypothetical protein